MALSFTLEGLELSVDLEQAARDQVSAVVSYWVEDLRAALEAAARTAAPSRTGNLRDRITATITSEGTILLQSGASYSAAVLMGTRPHEMTALVGRVVSFVVDGRRITRKVGFVGFRNGRRYWYYPGTQPRDFLAAALESSEVQSILQDVEDAGAPVAIAYMYQQG